MRTEHLRLVDSDPRRPTQLTFGVGLDPGERGIEAESIGSPADKLTSDLARIARTLRLSGRGIG